MKVEIEDKEMEKPPSSKGSSRIFSYDSMTTKEWEGGKKHPADPWDLQTAVQALGRRKQGGWIWLREILR